MQPTLRLGRVPDPLDNDIEDDPAGLFKSSGEAYRQDVVPLSRGEQVASAESVQPSAAPKGGKFSFDLYGGMDQPRAQPAPKAEPRAGKFQFDLYGNEPKPEAEAPAPKEPGLDISGGLKKGFKGLAVTWDFLANKLEKAVTGSDEDTGQILAKSADEYRRLESDPRIAELVRKGDAAPDTMSAVTDMLGYAVRNPTMIANFLAEQVPGMTVGGGIGAVATAPVKAAAVGAATRLGASAGVQTAVGAGATGAGINTGAVVFQSLGSNYVEGLSKYKGDTEAASEYAVTKTAAEVPANAIAGAFLGLNPFASKLANVGTQAVIQGAGGAAGAYQAATAVGEEASRGEMILEFLGEAFSAPVDIMVEKFGAKGQDIDKTIEKKMEKPTEREEIYQALVADERVAEAMNKAGITGPDDPAFDGAVASFLGARRKAEEIAAVQPISDEERAQRTKERGEDVQAAFGDTASTGVGVGTDTNAEGQGVIKRESVRVTDQGLEPVGDRFEPVVLPESQTGNQARTTAIAPEDIVARQEGFEVLPAFTVDGRKVGNSFVSEKSAETFLFGPVNKETGKREGGYASSVEGMEFQIRRGKRAKSAGGGTFFFIEGREKQNSAGFVSEPAPQLQAQIDAVRDGRKKAAVLGTEDLSKVKTDGLTTFEVKGEDGKTAVVVVKDKKLVNKTRTRAKKVGLKQAMGEVLEYAEPTVTTEAKGDEVVVQQTDNKTGEIIKEEAVSPENVANVTPVPDTTTKVTTVEDAKAQRAEGEADATQAGEQPQGNQPERQGTGGRLEEGRDNRKQQAKEQEAGGEASRGNRPDEGKGEEAPKQTVEQKLKAKQKAKKEPKPEKPKAEKPEPKRTDGRSEAQIEEDAVFTWEDNDDGKVAHIPFFKLPKDVQNEWIEATAPENGDKPYATAELHDQIVQRVLNNARKERANAKAAENRKKAEQDQVFRVVPAGKGMTVDAVTKIFDKLVENWAKIPDVVIVQSESGLPESIQEEIRKQDISGKVPGVYNGGKVYLVADNLPNAKEVILTVAHEVTGHFGLRRLLGKAYEQTMFDIYNGNKSVRARADDMMVKEGLSKEHAVEEVLADMAEEGVTAENRNALQRIFALVRKMLRKIGISFVTDSDVRQIVANARRYVIEGDLEAGIGEAALDAPRMKAGASTFYSAMERAVRGAKQNSAPATDWKSIIKSLPNVKPDEIAWTGVNEWLDLKGKEKVSKEELLTFIAGNRVHINDVLLTSYKQDVKDLLPSDMVLEPSEDDVREFVRERVEQMDWDGVYQELGEEAPFVDEMDIAELRAWIAENIGWQNYLHQHRRLMERFQRGRVAKLNKPKHGDGSLVLPGGKNYSEIVLFDPSTPSYKQHDDIHFGDVTQGRAIGWLRVNERSDADGNSVLFIEELQSQRGQDLRKGKVVQANREKAEKLMQEYNSLLSQYMDVAESERPAMLEKMEDLKREHQKLKSKDTDAYDNVPDAPFVKKTEAWTALLLKRAIAYAVERGIDRIAWTTGEQQNERYGFAGDQLAYTLDKKTGLYTITVMRDGRNVRTVDDIKSGDLAEYVGDKAAEYITDEKNTLVENELGTSGVIEGENLKLFTANLGPYYNSKVPSVAKEVIGKDGKVEVMEIEGTGKQLGFVIPESLQQKVAEDGLPLFRRKDFESQYDDLSPKAKAIALAKGHYSPPGIKDRLDALRPIYRGYLVQGLFDKYQSIKKLGDELYMKARLSNGKQDGALSVLLHFGQVFDDGGALNLKKNTKGLIEVMQPLGKEVDRFLLWMAANRAEKLKAQDRERFFTDEEIRELKRMNLGTMENGKSRVATYLKVQQDMNAINKSVLDIALQKGLISQDAYNRFTQDIWYVPFYRNMEDNVRDGMAAAQISAKMTGQQFSNKLKGSSRPLNDLLDNVLLNWSHILSASMKNGAATEILAEAEKMQIAERIKPGQPVPKGAVKVMEKGQEVHYTVSDPLLLDTLTMVSTMQHSGLFTRAAAKLKTIFTQGVALNPTFKINVLVADAIQSLAVSDIKRNPLTNVFEGIRLYKDKRAEALAGGGLFVAGAANDGEQSANIRRLAREAQTTNVFVADKQGLKDALLKVYDKYERASEALENSSRLSLYTQMREKGLSHMEATFLAKDLQDYSLHGSFAAIQWLSQVVPYFNARMQGLYKLGRGGSEDPRRFGLVLLGVTAASLALYLGQMDDEDWRKREDWDRDTYWWYKIPGTETAVRIRKPFELGAISSIIERLTEQMVDSSVEGKVFGKRLLSILGDNLAMNPIPQIVKPIYELAANKNSFTDRPIESMAQQKLSPEMRINPSTSPAAIALANINGAFMDFASKATGESFNANNFKISPVQYDHLLRGYLGWVGTMVQAASAEAVRPFKEGETPAKRIDDYFIVGNFVRELPSNQSRFLSSFYENAKDVAMVQSDLKSYIQAREIDKAADLLEANRDKIALAKLYQSGLDRLNMIDRNIKFIQTDKNMSAEEKRMHIDRMTQLKIDVAQRIEELRVARKKEK